MNSPSIHSEISPIPPKKSGGRLILSVDDEPAVLFTRERILQQAGYAVVSAPSGGEAMKAFLRHAIDLVLLDYGMPGMDGGIVAREMKRRKPLVPIVMVSADHAPDETRTCLDCFIAKAEGPTFLLKQIRRLLEPASDLRNSA